MWVDKTGLKVLSQFSPKSGPAMLNSRYGPVTWSSLQCDNLRVLIVLYPAIKCFAQPGPFPTGWHAERRPAWLPLKQLPIHHPQGMAVLTSTAFTAFIDCDQFVHTNCLPNLVARPPLFKPLTLAGLPVSSLNPPMQNPLDLTISLIEFRQVIQALLPLKIYCMCCWCVGSPVCLILPVNCS